MLRRFLKLFAAGFQSRALFCAPILCRVCRGRGHPASTFSAPRASSSSLMPGTLLLLVDFSFSVARTSVPMRVQVLSVPLQGLWTGSVGSVSLHKHSLMTQGVLFAGPGGVGFGSKGNPGCQSFEASPSSPLTSQLPDWRNRCRGGLGVESTFGGRRKVQLFSTRHRPTRSYPPCFDASRQHAAVRPHALM